MGIGDVEARIASGVVRRRVFGKGNGSSRLLLSVLHNFHLQLQHPTVADFSLSHSFHQCPMLCEAFSRLSVQRGIVDSLCFTQH